MVLLIMTSSHCNFGLLVLFLKTRTHSKFWEVLLFFLTMKIIYKVFAADDQEGDAALAGDTMNSTELVSFCREVRKRECRGSEAT